MAANILAAIGAALQQGQHTFGRLTYDEQERKRQEQQAEAQREQQRVQNAMAEHRMAQDDEQFKAQKEDRTYRRIQDALENADPNGAINQETFDAATPEQRNRLDVTNEGEQFVTPGAGMGMGGFGLTLGKSISRKPTLQENKILREQDQDQEALTRKRGFQDHLTSPEHAGETFDQQSREVFAQTGNSMPMSSAEHDRREALQTTNRLKEIKASTAWHGQVASNKPKAVDPMLSKWLSTKSQVADDLRATARGAIEQASTFEEAKAIMDQIDAEAEARTVKMLGGRPQTAADAPATSPQSGDQVDQWLVKYPTATIEEVRTSDLPLEDKKAIIARLMNRKVGAELPAAPPAPANIRVK